jgi:6-phosphogluconolactonase
MIDIQIFDSLQDLSREAARRFISLANDAIKVRGKFAVSLSGGNTPMTLYKLLAGEFADQLDWSKVVFFIGDERNVPTNNSRSNFRSVNETLFKPLGINDSSIFHWETDHGDKIMIVCEFETMLRDYFEGSPEFDLILLGLGDDGHTASLFPDTAALGEKTRFVSANDVKKLDEMRFTLTFPAINNARNVIFLVSGAGKADAAADVFGTDRVSSQLPAAFVQPVNGTLSVLIDHAAAAGLTVK